MSIVLSDRCVARSTLQEAHTLGSTLELQMPLGSPKFGLQPP